jgi:hypothetical protein
MLNAGLGMAKHPCGWSSFTSFYFVSNFFLCILYALEQDDVQHIFFLSISKHEHGKTFSNKARKCRKVLGQFLRSNANTTFWDQRLEYKHFSFFYTLSLEWSVKKHRNKNIAL